MNPAYLSDQMLAHLLGKKVTWLRSKRAQLEADGFPAKDALLGATNAADVNAWIAKRRRLPDPEPAAPPKAATNQKEPNYDRL